MCAETARKPGKRLPAQVILVVEDEVLVRLAIAEYLRTCGYEVIEAGNAAEAVEVLTSGIHIDLVFSDVQMPGEMDGFGLATWMRQQHPDVKIILTSGYARAAEKAGELCTHGPMLRKPYHEREVVRLIRQLLAHAAGGRSP